MKLPEGFNGYAIAKVCKVYNSPYDMNELLCQLDEAKKIKIHVIVSDNINIGGWKYIYMSNNNNINIRTVYDDDMDLYESMDTNAKNDCVYMIKILKITE